MIRSTTKILTALIALGGSPAVLAEQAKVSPAAVSGATTITALEAKELFDAETVFVDVRSDMDFEAGRIPGAVHLELKKVFSENTLLEVAAKRDKVVLYCNGPKCMRSSKASAKAVAWGFERVHYFRDGYPAWKAEGYPVE